MVVDLEELRKMDIKELKKRLDELRADLIKYKAQARLGTLKNTASIRNTKKDIARILTVINEKRRESKNKK